VPYTDSQVAEHDKCLKEYYYKALMLEDMFPLLNLFLHDKVVNGPITCIYNYRFVSMNLIIASSVFGRSNIGIAGSNPARGMDVCLRFSVLCCVPRSLLSNG
jgi:hypothetical protein